ncbi:MAG: hypothetical protein WCV68_02250 [Candidatus Paceibacterota bacterium]
MKNKVLLILICLLEFPVLAGAETKWQKMQASRAENYGKMMITNLSYSHERSQKLYDSVVLEIQKLPNHSNNEALLNIRLAEIKIILTKNQAEIDRLKLSLTPENAPKANWTETKNLVKSIIRDLRLSHSKIKKMLELLEK